jgi:hypothetical protein
MGTPTARDTTITSASSMNESTPPLTKTTYRASVGMPKTLLYNPTGTNKNTRTKASVATVMKDTKISDVGRSFTFSPKRFLLSFAAG